MSKAVEGAGPPLWVLQGAAGPGEGFQAASISDFPCRLHGAW